LMQTVLCSAQVPCAQGIGQHGVNLGKTAGRER